MWCINSRSNNVHDQPSRYTCHGSFVWVACTMYSRTHRLLTPENTHTHFCCCRQCVLVRGDTRHGRAAILVRGRGIAEQHCVNITEQHCASITVQHCAIINRRLASNINHVHPYAGGLGAARPQPPDGTITILLNITRSGRTLDSVPYLVNIRAANSIPQVHII